MWHTEMVSTEKIWFLLTDNFGTDFRVKLDSLRSYGDHYIQYQNGDVKKVKETLDEMDRIFFEEEFEEDKETEDKK